ncbi:MAG TPA: phospholipid carrier-dependent glycosyltransferase, partial [Steroidobacteraceae bacterium]|nr:phospholipid carrier-dependent glycosyltransferase [Steroidobacteraceae bacterium]
MSVDIFNKLALTRDWFLRHATIVLIAMILASCALVASTYQHFRHTWDEPEHLAAGMQLIDKHIYTYDQQHPPLARLAMAIGPYLAGAHSFGEPGPSGEQEGRDLLYRTGNYTLLLTLARIGMLPFLIVLLFATWKWANEMYGTSVAYIATVFLIATPPVLGHAGIAALDVPGAALCTLAFFCMLRWLQTLHWKYALVTAFVSGLAVATKLSGLPFIAVVAAAWSAFALLASNNTSMPLSKRASRWTLQSISILC